MTLSDSCQLLLQGYKTVCYYFGSRKISMGLPFLCSILILPHMWNHCEDSTNVYMCLHELYSKTREVATGASLNLTDTP